MAVIKGSDIMLFTKEGADLKATAYATNHTLDLQGDELETTSKDSGKWKESQVTKLGWSATSENLVGGLGAADAFTTLFDKWVARTAIDVHLTLASNADSDVGVPAGGWTPDATGGYKGKAYITNLSMNASDGQNATMTISLKGSGKLEKGSGT